MTHPESTLNKCATPLFIIKRPLRSSDLQPSLFTSLANDFDLDGATARQRLLGRGYSTIGKGGGEHAKNLQNLLFSHSIKSWLITPTTPPPPPGRVREIVLTNKALQIITDHGELLLNSKSRCLILLADISGQAIARQLKRIRAQGLYRAQNNTTQIGNNELYRQILLSRPVLDIYLLDDNGHIRAGARFVPGRFNPHGLKKHMSHSAAQNLLTILKVAKKLSHHSTIDLNFGFSSLPGCTLRQTPENKRERAAALQHNLRGLTRYGGFVADIVRYDRLAQQQHTPIKGKTESIGVLPIVTDTIEIATAPNETTKDAPLFEPTPPPPQGLPAPPEPPEKTFSLDGRMLLRLGPPALILAIFPLLIMSGNATALHFFVDTGLLSGGLALFMCWNGFYYLRLRRHMANTPTSKIRSLAMGMVEIHGQATRKYALISPMSQTPCVYYRLRKYRRGSKNRWILKSDKNSGHVPFSINDGTGTIAVNPTGADVHAGVKNEGRPDSYMETGWISLDSGSAQKWVEEVVPEGADLYVLGFARPLHAKHKSIKERTVAALRELKLNRSKMQQFDANGDGQIDESEWETARSQTEREVLHQTLTEKKQQPTAQQAQIGRPGARGLPFVIAEAASEAKLTRKFGWLAGLLFGGAALAASWTLYRIILVL